MTEEQKAEAARMIAQLEEVGTKDPLKNPLIFGGQLKTHRSLLNYEGGSTLIRPLVIAGTLEARCDCQCGLMADCLEKFMVCCLPCRRVDKYLEFETQDVLGCLCLLSSAVR